jgi:hypothetical protein
VLANGLMVAMSSAASTSCYTSTDAINWTTRTLPSSHIWLAPVYNPTSGVWLVNSSTNGGPYARSTDNGATWATVTGGTPIGGAVVSSSGGDTIKVFAGKFVVPKSGATFVSLLQSADGLVWSVAPIPTMTGTYANVRVLGSEIYFWPSNTGSDCWVSPNLTDWSYQASAYMTPTAVAWAVEANGVQAFFLASTTTTHRRPVYTYSSSTQFAVPNVPSTHGATAYIKA